MLAVSYASGRKAVCDGKLGKLSQNVVGRCASGLVHCGQQGGSSSKVSPVRLSKLRGVVTNKVHVHQAEVLLKPIAWFPTQYQSGVKEIRLMLQYLNNNQVSGSNITSQVSPTN